MFNIVETRWIGDSRGECYL